MDVAEVTEALAEMTLSSRLIATVAEISAVAARCARPQPRLVAVSKTKPAAAVKELYDAGHRHFGENYVHELVEKAPLLASDVCWHFIGQLQSNKVKALVTGVPCLWAVESVDSEKLAGKLETAVAGLAPPRAEALRVFVQVNTTGEPQKGGVETARDAASLGAFIRAKCPHLAFTGLMTIGKLGDIGSVYFERLVAARATVAEELGLNAADLELSMGMSGDWQLALEHGSTNVRIGSAIFGERQYGSQTGALASSCVESTVAQPKASPENDSGVIGPADATGDTLAGASAASTARLASLPSER